MTAVTWFLEAIRRKRSLGEEVDDAGGDCGDVGDEQDAERHDEKERQGALVEVGERLVET